MRAFRQIFCLKILNPHMGPLREIQLAIEKRSLSRGGWASGNGRAATKMWFLFNGPSRCAVQ